MEKLINEVYNRVDEKFMDCFSERHRQFMKEVYYKEYTALCAKTQRTPLNENAFFTNMHRRRIQLFQLCCPYCKTILIMFKDKKIQGSDGFNYCPKCGRGSAVQNISNQIYRFIRIDRINQRGLKELKEKYPDKEEWLLGYDCYQMEIITLASVIEIVLRDYFEALLFIENNGEGGEYITKAIRKQTGNDFMNIDKANKDFKDAFGINIKATVKECTWNDLIDIVNLRNMMVHNNGVIDSHFKTTQTFLRLKAKDMIDGDLVKINSYDLKKYLTSVIDAFYGITNIFLERYYAERNKVIASYYFNKT